MNKLITYSHAIHICSFEIVIVIKVYVILKLANNFNEFRRAFEGNQCRKKSPLRTLLNRLIVDSRVPSKLVP